MICLTPKMVEIIRKNGRAYTIKENKDRFLFPKEYMLIFDNLKAKQKHTLKVQINTGARINELQNVMVADCFLKDKRILLKVTKAKARKGEKKGKQRMIPISTDFAKYLKRYISRKKLGVNDRIGMLSTPATNIAYKKAGKLVEIKDYQNISSHTIRKTLECWLMSLGTQDSILVSHFGHDLRTAVSSYVSPDIFSLEEKSDMRLIIGNLYQRQ